MAKTDVYESLRQPWGSLGGVAVADMSAHNFGPGAQYSFTLGRVIQGLFLCVTFLLYSSDNNLALLQLRTIEIGSSAVHRAWRDRRATCSM